MSDPMFKPRQIQAATPIEPKRLRGLGDVVAIVAQPIAQVVDKVAGTKLTKCGGCKRRREKLNAAFPIGKP